MGLVPLEKAPWRAPLAFWLCEDTEITAICEPGSGLSLANSVANSPELASALILDFPVSRTMRKKCLLFINYPIYIFLL